jgi:signal transduction histidine kinase
MSGDEQRVLTEEQSGLRRVVTLIASGASPDDVIESVSGEVGRLVGADAAGVGRYQADGTSSALGGWSRSGSQHIPPGIRLALNSGTPGALVLETRMPARVDHCEEVTSDMATGRQKAVWRSAIGAPITVEGRLWGFVSVVSKGARPLPANTEECLAPFAELVAIAVTNAQSRARLARLADEQAGLRRVAMLVALGGAPEGVFAAAVREVGSLLGTDFAGMARFNGDDTVSVLAAWPDEGDLEGADPFVAGPRPIQRDDLASAISSTRRSVRIDDYRGASGPIAAAVRDKLGIRSSVASPIFVGTQLWGALFVDSRSAGLLPRHTEARLTEFTELVATAIANAEGRAERSRLAEEQAALRRVATLVASGAPAEEVFAGVAREVGHVLGVRMITIDRYEPDASSTVVASLDDPGFPVGSRWPLDGPSLGATVLETGRPARVDDYSELQSTVAGVVRAESISSTVGVPILVQGALWGVICVGSSDPTPLPSDTEDRLAAFTELLETAISNAHSRAELMASRARIASAADETRRRIERDLHDGTQQRLVSLGLELRAARENVPRELGELDLALSRVSEGMAEVFDQLREISRGIHPAILSEGGLKPALNALRRRSAVSVELKLHTEERLPERVEVAAYYVVSEALTNATKHAHASVVNIELAVRSGTLYMQISDDGVGGAELSRGSGLVGLRDRVEALGGSLQVMSPPGSGTSLLVELPVDS